LQGFMHGEGQAAKRLVEDRSGDRERGTGGKGSFRVRRAGIRSGARVYRLPERANLECSRTGPEGRHRDREGGGRRKRGLEQISKAKRSSDKQAHGSTDDGGRPRWQDLREQVTHLR